MVIPHVQELLAAKQEINSFNAKLVEKDAALEKKAKEVMPMHGVEKDALVR
jgi:hypothetical protein